MEIIPSIVCDTLYSLGLHDKIPSWKVMDNKGRVTVVLHWDPEEVAALRGTALPAIAGPTRQSSTCSTIASGGPRLLGIRSISQRSGSSVSSTPCLSRDNSRYLNQDHAYLSACLFECTLIWVHAYLSAKFFKCTHIRAHSYLRVRLFASTLICAYAYLQINFAIFACNIVKKDLLNDFPLKLNFLGHYHFVSMSFIIHFSCLALQGFRRSCHPTALHARSDQFRLTQG